MSTTHRHSPLTSLTCQLAAAVLVTGGHLLPAAPELRAATLEVGPGKRFARIEDANAKARPGDVILVHSLADGKAFEQTAVFVRQQRVKFRAAARAGAARVKISGKGFDYSGVGSTPRAIFQFNAGADHCVLEGFELFGAHNESHNGAGVRIVEANHVTVRDCSIHHNDMGIMSNGDGTPRTALNQRIENCEIHHNGDPSHPGYNHNLYVGGTSITLSGCQVYSSLTGHNVKSRAHHTRIEYSYIHHSANREFDLVDGGDTAAPESHAVLIGNVIVKDPEGKGNGTVIHFGQDGGRPHDGTLHLVFNTIITSSIAPVIDLSSPGARARLTGNLVSDGGRKQTGQQIANARGGARLDQLIGTHNCFVGGFERGAPEGLKAPDNRFQPSADGLFLGAAGHHYRLRPQADVPSAGPLSRRELETPPPPGVSIRDLPDPLAWQYRYPTGKESRPMGEGPRVGAYGP